VESHRGVEVAFVEETALLVVAAAIFICGAVDGDVGPAGGLAALEH
jgi:hypothetical protein